MTDTSNSGIQVVHLMDSVEFPVRASYFYGFEGFKDKDDPKKISYPSHFIMPPNHPAVALVKAAQRAAAIGQWKDGAEDMLAALSGQDRLCLHNGNVSKPGNDDYKGMVFVSGNAKKRFTIVGPDRTPLTSSDALAPYSGCHVNAIIQVWAQQNTWGKRINAQIMGVQFTRHGESFGGGRVAAPDEFGIVGAAGADGAAPAAAGNAAGLF